MITSSPLKLHSWQRRLVAVAWITYAAYYLARSNLAVAIPSMSADLAFSKSQVGALGTGFFWSYALGQLINGQLGDRVNLRRFVTAGMLGSALLSFSFGWLSLWLPMFILWTLNGYFQATGWGPILRTLANWLSSEQRRRISGAFGSCFVAGNAITLLLTGWLVSQMGWRAAFWAPAVLLSLFALIWYVLARETPEAAGHPAVNPSRIRPDVESLAVIVAGMGHSFRRHWALVLAAVFQGFCLVSLILWVPTYYVEVGELAIDTAATLSSLIPVAGIAGTLMIGWFQGKYLNQREPSGLIVALAILAILFLLYPALPLQVAVSAAALMIIGIVLYGASSLLLTTMPLVLGGHEEASSTAGLIDFSFNIGGGLSGAGIGLVLDAWSWNTVFFVLAGAAILATVFVGLTIMLQGEPS